MEQQSVERRTAWIHDEVDVALYLSDILFWVVRSEDPEGIKRWWESGKMPYPDDPGQMLK